MMALNAEVRCVDFPCGDVDHSRHRIPALDVDPAAIRVVVISEGAAPEPEDDFYSGGDPLFARTTLAAFREAGIDAGSVGELLDRGVYLTTAVKCAKTGPGISAATINACSHLLETELDQFSKARAYLLMGDVAIKAINAIGRRRGLPRPIPAGSTYKIRGADYHLDGIRLFPSYLQAGPAYLIEASKRRMIAEDIRTAMGVVS